MLLLPLLLVGFVSASQLLISDVTSENTITILLLEPVPRMLAYLKPNSNIPPYLSPLTPPPPTRVERTTEGIGAGYPTTTLTTTSPGDVLPSYLREMH
eukprot:sb/3478892/